MSSLKRFLTIAFILLEIILHLSITAEAAKTKFGAENDIRAKIDRENGDISLHKVLTIVDAPENLDVQISQKF